jgi:AAA15 family ATPase/GTPase
MGFEAKRINVFIGEPNAGKSNILEALGIYGMTSDNLSKLIRYERLDNLFYDNEVENKIEVKLDDYKYIVIPQDHNLKFQFSKLESNPSFTAKSEYTDFKSFSFEIDNSSRGSSDSDNTECLTKLYKFTPLHEFKNNNIGSLNYPHGDNLFTILRGNSALRELAVDILKEKGYKLNLRIGENKIELVKDKGALYSYPYQTVSDTLQRIIFYTAVIESNKDSVILLEEPESNIFPFYTKYLAEKIAMDQQNQYFTVTHNPYFLMSLVEKTPSTDLSVFITTMKDYETQIHLLTSEQVSEMMSLDNDIFFNLDRFTE